LENWWGGAAKELQGLLEWVAGARDLEGPRRKSCASSKRKPEMITGVVRETKLYSHQAFFGKETGDHGDTAAPHAGVLAAHWKTPGIGKGSPRETQSCVGMRSARNGLGGRHPFVVSEVVRSILTSCRGGGQTVCLIVCFLGLGFEVVFGDEVVKMQRSRGKSLQRPR
jgi:hypothetical protein